MNVVSYKTPRSEKGVVINYTKGDKTNTRQPINGINESILPSRGD